MTATTTPELAQIHSLLAEQGYAVSETAADSLSIREVDSGVTVRAVLQGNIVFFSLTCTTVASSAITAEAMRRMLAAENGISTSHFQLYDFSDGRTAITLNNFCVLQDMGAEDEDDILSCVHFLLVDVLAARRVLGNLGA
jgi:hypothetical protein